MLQFEGNYESAPYKLSQPGELRKKIQKYSFFLSDKIGRGFSSTVYKGQNDQTLETVAIKVIELKSLRDQVTKNLLKTELECIKKISHPHLLNFIDSYETVNNCYIVTEYCENGDLQKELRKKGKFTENQIMEFFTQFYEGYQSFLQAGFIHRDLKPANIFLKGKSIKIADFGMVKRTSENPKESYNVGTPIYMPPESLNSNIYTEKSDIWSMGIILYQLSHGKLPWRGINEKELKLQIYNNEPKFDGSLISEELINLISCCLEKNSCLRIGLKDMGLHPWMVKARKCQLGNISPLDQFLPSLPIPVDQMNRKSFHNTNSVKNLHSYSSTNLHKIKSLGKNILGEKNLNVSSQDLGHCVMANLSINLDTGMENKTMEKAERQDRIENKYYNHFQNVSLSPSLSPVPMPSINLANVKNYNSSKQLRYFQPSKSERPTMDSEIKKKAVKNQSQEAPPGSLKEKKSTLDYLVSILNYLRFVFKVYRLINEYRGSWPESSSREQVKEILMTELMVGLKKQEEMVKSGENVYCLKDWENFYLSKKWTVYCGVVEQYSVKYRKIYESNKPFNLVKEPSSHLSSPIKTRNLELKQSIRNILQFLKNRKTEIRPFQMGRGRGMGADESEECDEVEGRKQRSQFYSLMEILDYLVSIHNLANLISSEGWFNFVEKSPINRIVECRCIVNQDNYDEILEKLQRKVSQQTL